MREEIRDCSGLKQRPKCHHNLETLPSPTSKTQPTYTPLCSKHRCLLLGSCCLWAFRGVSAVAESQGCLLTAVGPWLLPNECAQSLFSPIYEDRANWAPGHYYQSLPALLVALLSALHGSAWLGARTVLLLLWPQCPWAPFPSRTSPALWRAGSCVACRLCSPPPQSPFTHRGPRLHSSRLPLAVGRLLVFFLQVTALIPSCLPLDLLRCPESACFPGSRYRMLLHHLFRPFPCLLCLYHITTSEILNVSAVWLPSQK